MGRSTPVLAGTGRRSAPWRRWKYRRGTSSGPTARRSRRERGIDAEQPRDHVSVRDATGAEADRPVALVAVLGLVGATVVYKRAGFAPRALAGVTAAQLLVGALVLLPPALLLEGAPALPATTAGWGALAYLVLVMSVSASLLWFWLLGHGEATRVSAFYFLVPVVGLVLSDWTLRERLAPRDLAGAAGIAAGIALVSGRGSAPVARAPSVRAAHPSRRRPSAVRDGRIHIYTAMIPWRVSAIGLRAARGPPPFSHARSGRRAGAVGARVGHVGGLGCDAPLRPTPRRLAHASAHALPTPPGHPR